MWWRDDIHHHHLFSPSWQSQLVPISAILPYDRPPLKLNKTSLKPLYVQRTLTQLEDFGDTDICFMYFLDSSRMLIFQRLTFSWIFKIIFVRKIRWKSTKILSKIMLFENLPLQHSIRYSVRVNLETCRKNPDFETSSEKRFFVRM